MKIKLKIFIFAIIVAIVGTIVVKNIANAENGTIIRNQSAADTFCGSWYIKTSTGAYGVLEGNRLNINANEQKTLNFMMRDVESAIRRTNFNITVTQSGAGKIAFVNGEQESDAASYTWEETGVQGDNNHSFLLDVKGIQEGTVTLVFTINSIEGTKDGASTTLTTTEMVPVTITVGSESSQTVDYFSGSWYLKNSTGAYGVLEGNRLKMDTNEQKTLNFMMSDVLNATRRTNFNITVTQSGTGKVAFVNGEQESDAANYTWEETGVQGTNNHSFLLDVKGKQDGIVTLSFTINSIEGTRDGVSTTLSTTDMVPVTIAIGNDASQEENSFGGSWYVETTTGSYDALENNRLNVGANQKRTLNFMMRDISNAIRRTNFNITVTQSGTGKVAFVNGEQESDTASYTWEETGVQGANNHSFLLDIKGKQEGTVVLRFRINSIEGTLNGENTTLTTDQMVPVAITVGEENQQTVETFEGSWNIENNITTIGTNEEKDIIFTISPEQQNIRRTNFNINVAQSGTGRVAFVKENRELESANYTWEEAGIDSAAYDKFTLKVKGKQAGTVSLTFSIGIIEGKKDNVDTILTTTQMVPVVITVGSSSSPDDNQGTNQGDNQGTNQGENQGTNQGENQGTNQGENQGTNQGDNQGTNQGENQGTNQGDNQGTNQGENQGTNQGGNQGTNQGENQGSTAKDFTIKDSDTAISTEGTKTTTGSSSNTSIPQTGEASTGIIAAIGIVILIIGVAVFRKKAK